MNETISHPDLWQLAATLPDTAVREAAYETAVNAYENARTDGLCHEGALEIGFEIIRGFKDHLFGS
jgi:hypothetical protein